jgi:hypothetical protein
MPLEEKRPSKLLYQFRTYKQEIYNKNGRVPVIWIMSQMPNHFFKLYVVRDSGTPYERTQGSSWIWHINQINAFTRPLNHQEIRE